MAILRLASVHIGVDDRFLAIERKSVEFIDMNDRQKWKR